MCGRPGWPEVLRWRLRRVFRRTPGGASTSESFHSWRSAWEERLTDPDPLVALGALTEARERPGLDCSPAATHPDRTVRLAAVSSWGSLDDVARELLRADVDRQVASAASPALTCRVFVSCTDTDDHERMFGLDLTRDERLSCALGTLGRRTLDGEWRHVACVLRVVDIVVAQLGPDEARLAERAATVGAAALRSVGVVAPRADDRLTSIGVHLFGTASGMAWHDRLNTVSTPPTGWDWDGSRKRAAQEAERLYEREGHQPHRGFNSQDAAAERCAALRRGEYPALRRVQRRKTDRPRPRRRTPGY